MAEFVNLLDFGFSIGQTTGMTSTHEDLIVPWAQLCEMAECSPDCDVMLDFDETRVVYWMRARLIARGHNTPASYIRAAYIGKEN